MERTIDGSAGDADYGQIGRTYNDYRRPDPRISAVIRSALCDARTVINIGAGTGSYEPSDLEVTAVEPSESMRRRRPTELPEAVDAVAENLPFDGGAFDAAMTTFSVHQWSDLGAGLAEMRRVSKGPVVILTCNPDLVRDFWLYDYCPEALDTEARRYPSIAELKDAFGEQTVVNPVPIPLDCADGFNEAYYGRPEILLDSSARLACSAWSFVDPAATSIFEQRLRDDLENGEWDRNHGHLRSQASYHGSLVLVVANNQKVSPASKR